MIAVNVYFKTMQLPSCRFQTGCKWNVDILKQLFTQVKTTTEKYLY